MTAPTPDHLKAIFGNLDIYLFDQLLKGTVREGMRVLDAGCGAGRNVQYLMQAGIEIYGADVSAEAIAQVRKMAAHVTPPLPYKNFVVADLASLPYADAFLDVVLCSAVLHFARNEVHFRRIVQELVRVLKPGGLFFCRLSTTIGMEGKLQQVNERQYQMPHGPVWFLTDAALLQELEKEFRLTRAEPLKTVLVEQERSMTTWVLRKR